MIAVVYMPLVTILSRSDPLKVSHAIHPLLEPIDQICPLTGGSLHFFGRQSRKFIFDPRIYARFVRFSLESYLLLADDLKDGLSRAS
jgi:hypothetical protein